jgi:hypothetical protein
VWQLINSGAHPHQRRGALRLASLVLVGHQVEGDQFVFRLGAVNGFLDGFVWRGGHHSDHVGPGGIVVAAFSAVWDIVSLEVGNE